ncbi:hypothetical protein KW800_00985 [Candidatus Parcubacteria bacterium]|nr:hypothetical protein [Candidatus Parcubacteria bacterium]
MIAVALFFDAMQALLDFIFLGWLLVPPVAIFTFWLWFKLKGLDFFTARRGKLIGASVVIKLIPFLGDLPVWTGLIARIALDYKIKKTVGI